MNEYLYNSFLEEWVPKQADIIADLEYQKNLADHLVTTEIMYRKLDSYFQTGLIIEDDVEQWQVLGYTILKLQHQIYNIIPDFPSKQRGQLMALSKEMIKEQRFHNDAILAREQTLTEQEFLEKLKGYDIMIQDAVITPDKILKVILRNPQVSTLPHTATFLSRQVDAHGVILKQLMIYSPQDVHIGTDFFGPALFVKEI